MGSRQDPVRAVEMALHPARRRAIVQAIPPVIVGVVLNRLSWTERDGAFDRALEHAGVECEAHHAIVGGDRAEVELSHQKIERVQRCY